MKDDAKSRNDVFQQAWKIIEGDTTIPPEEKEGIFKTLQALIKAAETFPTPQSKEEQVQSLAQELVSNYSLIALVKQQTDELNALKNLSLNLTSSLDLQTTLDAVVGEAMRLVKKSHAAYIYLYSEGKLSFGASLNAEGVINKPTSMPRSNGLTYSAVSSGERLIVEDIASHPLYYKNTIPQVEGSVISIPLKSGDTIVGVMNLSRSIKGKFPKSELRLLGLLANQAAVTISNARLHKVVKDLANTDSITGLPNRRALDERLLEEVRYANRMNTEFAVVMMDMDGFKNVNDTFGHTVGDEFLRSLFNYLANSMRDTDFLARYGGDELTLVMRNTGVESAEIVTRKIINLVKHYEFPFPDHKNIPVGLTAGIAIYPLHTHIPGDLLRAADAALYQGKKHYRGSYVVAKKNTGALDAITQVNDPKS